MTSESYYEHERPEVAALVPATSRRIIDIGCGGGALGGLLKRQRPGIEVRGVEPVADAAERARARLDDVFHGGAEQAPPDHWPTADCLIFADVLEHLVEPWQTLRGWVERLPTGASAVVSVPNVAFGDVVWPLLQGRWEYEREGVMDRTHLRWFTRASLLELMRGAGLEVTRVTRAMTAPRSGGPLGKALRWFGGQYERREPTEGARGLGRFVLDTCSPQILAVGHKR